jgi:hypothetical protein
MPPRAVTVVVLGATLCVASSALALDKIQSTLEQPRGVTGTSLPPLAGPFSTAWVAGTSKGSFKHLGCKLQVKLSHTNLGTGDGTPGTGDEVICLGDANIAYEGANLPTTAVFRGERNAGGISIKLDLAQETTGPGSCGAVDDLVVYDARITCYEPDPTYAVSFSQPFQSDATQGVVVGAYAPRPSSPLIATQAILIPCLTGSCP